MLIACKCLNVIIDLKNDSSVFDISNLNLSQEEKSEGFFKEKLIKFDSNQVTVQLKSLVQSKPVGIWTIEHCLNCSTGCYSTTPTDRSLSLADASLLVEADYIERMKKSKDYSPVFRIIVMPSAVENKLNSSDSRQSPQIIQTALSSLQQQMNEAIRREVIKTEEKIRLHTELQYKLLEEFRERVADDHRILAQRIYETQPIVDGDLSPRDSDLPVTYELAGNVKKVSSKRRSDVGTRDSSQVSECESPPFSGSHSADSPAKNSTRANGGNSIDSEGLFVLEGMEESFVQEPLHSEGESDTDHEDSGSHDEGIDIHRKRRTVSFHMAKSLPVNVPVYPVPSTDVEDDNKIPGVVDIAASIKALARSVHGDAIFGDLPRPRFSTQI